MAEWPQVVEVVRDSAFPQKVRTVRINGMDIGAYSVTVTRTLNEPPIVTITFPAEYVEQDAK